MSRRVFIAVVLAMLATARETRAQTGDPAAAAELFRQGRAAMLEKRYDLACPKLAESERLDPKVGTLINLALCEEETSHLVAALARWDEATKLAHTQGDPREQYAAQRHDALAARMARVTIALAPGAPPDTRVELDGESLAPDALGTARILNPGAHVVVVKAAGRSDKRIDAEARAAEASAVMAEPGPPLPVAVTPPVAPVATPIPPLASANVQRLVAYGIGGAGVISAVVGAVFGAQAIQAKNDPACSGSVCSTQAATQDQENGIADGNQSTVAFVVAGALVAGGVVVWLTAPKNAAQASSTLGFAVVPGPGGTSLGVVGAW